MSSPAAYDPDVDLAKLASRTSVKVAAAFLALGGLTTATSAAQVLSIVRFAPEWALGMLYAQLALGAAGLLLALGLVRQKGYAAIGAVLLVPSVAVLDLGWLAYSFSERLFSLMAVLATFFGILALIAVPFAFRAVREASAARTRLEANGIELGF